MPSVKSDTPGTDICGFGHIADLTIPVSASAMRIHAFAFEQLSSGYIAQ
jgi:hypothetical protein